MKSHENYLRIVEPLCGETIRYGASLLWWSLNSKPCTRRTKQPNMRLIDSFTEAQWCIYASSWLDWIVIGSGDVVSPVRHQSGTSAGWTTLGYHTREAMRHIDELIKERRNASALAMELRLSCINPSTWSYGISTLSFVLLHRWRRIWCGICLFLDISNYIELAVQCPRNAVKHAHSLTRHIKSFRRVISVTLNSIASLLRYLKEKDPHSNFNTSLTNIFL